jgi:hypothetical protein
VHRSLQRHTTGSQLDHGKWARSRSLKEDPLLRFTDAGRSLLRLLDRSRAGMAGNNKIAEMVPDHCTGLVAELARGYAQM